jgi:hypothetical protein
MLHACVQRFDVMDGRGNILGSHASEHSRSQVAAKRARVSCYGNLASQRQNACMPHQRRINQRLYTNDQTSLPTQKQRYIPG